MLRSVGIAAVVVGLVWTGLAGAQSSSPLEKARYINVSEEGKSPQRCKLLRTWREPNGVPAFQVEAVDTGEIMTIVGTAPKGSGGDSREMTTRIFRWGKGNRPPAGAPLPPPTATAVTPPPMAQLVAERKPPTIAPQPIRPVPVAVTPRPTQTPVTVQKPSFTPSPAPSKPVSVPLTLTNNKSDAPTIVRKPMPSGTGVSPVGGTGVSPVGGTGVSQVSGTGVSPVVSSKPPALTPMGTQVIQYSPSPAPAKQLPQAPSASDSQPRLMPLAAGGIASPKPGSCPCSSPCDPCGKPCNPCGQSSCVNGTPSPMRQPLIGRLFKSNSPCPCTTVVSQTPSVALQSVATSTAKPAEAKPISPVVVKTGTEPAKPSDWRQSWGNVEPWKGSAQASASVKPIEVSKRVDPTPVPMDPPNQPSPINNPDHYRDLVMNARLANSRIPQESQASMAAEPNKHRLAKWTIGKPPAPRVAEPMPPTQSPEVMMTAPALPNGPMLPNRTVMVSADEPNAFSSPKAPAAGEKPRINAFHREPEPPQGIPPKQGVPPTISGIPPNVPIVPPMIPGIVQGPPPQAMMLKNTPRPPLAPYTAPPGPARPMAPDTGVAQGMGNAFTLAATHRPIPADFGGTPQEPNGFDPPIRGGDGSPPRGYGMSMSGAYRPQMPNMGAMAPQGQMAVNPLMNVPPSGRAYVSERAPAQTGSVPQMLAALKDSLRPSERETAAERLSELNWHVQPLVVESLMKSAREDPAATVRAACVHALAHMKVDTPAALALVRDLKSDREALVRQEAEEALSALGDSGIRQTSHK